MKGEIVVENEICRILIADDEPIERMVISKAVRNYFGDELEIVEAENGREAIARFLEQDCQIALLDISMPGIDGLEAAEKIRKENPTCSIIFLTAYDEFEYAKRAIKVRAMDYLLKPSAKDELIAVLEEAVYVSRHSTKEVTSLQRTETEEENEKKGSDKKSGFGRAYTGVYRGALHGGHLPAGCSKAASLFGCVFLQVFQAEF